MNNRFELQEAKTEHREIRNDKELRWLVNRESYLNPATGETITRSTIRHPGICVIVPFSDQDHILLLHQYRFAAEDFLWELPAGTLAGREEDARMAPTETPLECAARELREETGYLAAHLEKVCECYAMPGSSDELIHVFLASDLSKGETSPDAGEIIDEVRPFSLAELEAMIASGEIRDAKTLVGLFFALNRQRFGGF
ncbi:MAG: NUDIX hydrolase [Acidobacteria bacterium]|nr:NUDIX hydrolase [Acidobacteriota bacterium]